MEQIEEKLTAELRHDAVYLFKDFPICCNDSGTLELIRTRRFKRKFPALTRSCCNQNKHIFVLNS